MISLILGPMFAGKTTRMIADVKNKAYAGKAGLIIKHSFDIRYTDKPNTIITHAQQLLTSYGGSDLLEPIRVLVASKLTDVKPTANESVIGIDEGQFFPDIVEMSELWAQEGKEVYIAALSGDYNRNPFGRIPELISKCENIVFLKAVCNLCKNADGAFTVRLTPDVEIVHVGDSSAYRSSCRRCYFERTGNKQYI